jgi:hypothetical protein
MAIDLSPEALVRMRRGFETHGDPVGLALIDALEEARAKIDALETALIAKANVEIRILAAKAMP